MNVLQKCRKKQKSGWVDRIPHVMKELCVVGSSHFCIVYYLLAGFSQGTEVSSENLAPRCMDNKVVVS